MSHRPLIEALEPRDLFAHSVTPVYPQLAAGPGTILFNAVRTSNSTGSHLMQYQLRLTNKGSVRLSIQRLKLIGADPGDFQIVDFPAGGVSLAPGVQRNYTIQFNADDAIGLKTATLRIYSTDPRRNGMYNVPLRGLVTAGEGSNLEPSLQRLFELYDLHLDAGQVPHANDPYYVPSTTSEALDIQSLVKADASQPVQLVAMAVFTNHATPAVRMGFYTPGILDSEKYLWYSPSQSAQSVAPLVYGQSKFDPGDKPFGLVTQYPNFINADASVRNVYSENALNLTWDNNAFTHMKFYPYKDANGAVVPDSYIVAEEEYVKSTPDPYDNNDLIFIVRNVKPADAQPTLSYENLTGYPSNDTLAFNVIQNPDVNYANITRTTNTLRLRNSGTSNLHVSLGISGDFAITSGGGSNITIAPGAGVQDVKITFTATSGTALHRGQLVITSDDPNKPTTTINLVGNWQQYSEQLPTGSKPSTEPTAQTIVNQILGYQTALTTGSQSLNNHGFLQKVGDEISAEYFQEADANAPVSVVELAAFHNQTYLDSDGVTTIPTNSKIAWYKQGSPNTWTTILTDKPGQGQMIMPTLADGKTVANGATTGSKNPGAGVTFGFVVEPRTSPAGGEYSDHALNPDPNGGTDPSYGQYLRFFPLRDANGILVPNAYIMLHDYNKAVGTNFDFQDEIYIISNIVPVGVVKTPRTVYAESTAKGNTINFTSPDDGPKVFGFNVYRSDTPNGTYALLNTTGLLPRKPSGSFTDTTAVFGRKYYYQVKTVGNGGAESQPVMVQVN